MVTLESKSREAAVKGFDFGRLLIFICGLIVIALLWLGPFATNDGSVHINFAKFYADGLGEVQSRIYQFNPVIAPNWMVTFIGALLLKLFSPDVTESIIQSIVIVLPVIAAAWCFEGLRKGNGWLAFPVLAFGFDRLMSLGLYNFKLSIAGFFLTLGIYVRGREHPSPLVGLKLFLIIVLTFFCHGGSFITVIVAIAAALTYDLVTRWRSSVPLLQLTRQALPIISAVAGGLALLLGSLLMAESHGNIVFGADPFQRIVRIFAITALWMHSPIALLIGPAISLSISAAVVAILWRNRLNGELNLAGPKGAIAACAAALLLLSLFFPNQAGGGWGHIQRFAAFPIFGALMWLACSDHPRYLRNLIVGVSVLSTALLGSLTFVTQIQVKREMTDFDSAGRHIGTHCTVVPVVLDPSRIDGSSARFAPFFHAVSRLERQGDRVVLFNYLARLDVYPIRFNKAYDPQRLIYHWPAYTPATAIRVVDIPGFEAATGLTADYVLVRGIGAVGSSDSSEPWLSLRPYLVENYAPLPVEGSLLLFERRIRGPKCGQGMDQSQK